MMVLDELLDRVAPTPRRPAVFLTGAVIAMLSLVLSRLVPPAPHPGLETAFSRS